MDFCFNPRETVTALLDALYGKSVVNMIAFRGGDGRKHAWWGEMTWGTGARKSTVS